MALVRELRRSVGLPDEFDANLHCKVQVHEDNVGALTLANLEPQRMTPRSKHYAIKYHWFREHVYDKSNRIVIVKIDTKNQLGDMFSKGFSICQIPHVFRLGVHFMLSYFIFFNNYITINKVGFAPMTQQSCNVSLQVMSPFTLLRLCCGLETLVVSSTMNPPSVPYCGPPRYRVSCPLSASPSAPPYRACPPSALLFGPPSACPPSAYPSCPPSACPPSAYSLCPPSACPPSAYPSCPLSACPLSASSSCPPSTPHPSTLLRVPPYRTLQKPPDSTVEPTRPNTLLCLTTHGVYCRPTGVDCCDTIHHGDPSCHLLFIVNTVLVVTASFLLIHHHYTLDVVVPTSVQQAPSRAAEP
eukprot:scaffold15299_cov23-Cyclotella_meneghiniana.AAC.1